MTKNTRSKNSQINDSCLVTSLSVENLREIIEETVKTRTNELVENIQCLLKEVSDLKEQVRFLTDVNDGTLNPLKTGMKNPSSIFRMIYSMIPLSRRSKIKVRPIIKILSLYPTKKSIRKKDD